MHSANKLETIYCVYKWKRASVESLVSLYTCNIIDLLNSIYLHHIHFNIISKNVVLTQISTKSLARNR